ncbi:MULTISPECIES: hypothetical protein [Mesorhizobium]|nr:MULTISPECIES: hypothetical protein [Mesorhizobium]MCA0033935.1 hypothetical protein [Mesorhizobium sp. B263B2A]
MRDDHQNGDWLTLPKPWSDYIAGCARKSPATLAKSTPMMAGSLCASMASGANHDADLIMNALRKPN